MGSLTVRENNNGRLTLNTNMITHLLVVTASTLLLVLQQFHSATSTPVHTSHDRRISEELSTVDKPYIKSPTYDDKHTDKPTKLRRTKRQLWNGLSVTNSLEVLRRRYVEALRQRRRGFGSAVDHLNASLLSSVG